jgi:type IV secretion system protein VirB5
MISQLFESKRQELSDGITHQLARQRWQEQFGQYIHERNLWQRVAFFSLGLNLLAVLGMAWIGTQNKMIPYVVQVDKFGTALAVQRADVPMVTNAQSIKAHLARWIENTRSVYTDVAAEKQAVKQSYASINLNGPASAMLNDYFQKNEPFKKAENESVSVQIQSVQPISDQTWRIEWQEDHHDRNGGLISHLQEQATVSIVMNPPTDEATILLNPLGIYIDSFSWSQRL